MTESNTYAIVKRINETLRRQTQELFGLYENGIPGAAKKIKSPDYENGDMKYVEFPSFYQTKGVQFLLDKKRVLISDSTGVGKTAQAVLGKLAIEKYHKRAKTLVVIPNSAKTSWKEKIEEYVERKQKVIVIDKYTNEEFKKASTADFVIINYDIFSLGQKKEQITEQLLKMGFNYVILDEVHNIKNPKAFRSSYLKRLADNAEYLCTLSATPLPDHWKDIYMLISLLEPDRYKTPKDVEIAHGLQPEILSVILRNKKIKRELKDVAQLPPLTQIDLSKSLVLEDGQEQIYKAIFDNDQLTAGNKIHQLRKALLDPSLVNPKIIFDKKLRARLKEIESIKHKTLDKIVEDKATRGKKVVIFSPIYKTKVTSKLAERYESYGALVIDGDVPYKEREAIRKKFQHDPKNNILIATTATTGEAISLNSASTVVLLDEPFSPGDREQAIGRIYRRGQKNPVEVISVSVRETIDQGIVELLELKDKAITFFEEGGGKMPDELKDALEDELKSRPIVRRLYTPQQMVRRTATMMKDKGARRILRGIYKNPEIEKQYTENYVKDWETSYQANNGRVYSKIIETLSEKVDLGQKIDLGSGPGVLSYMLSEETTNVDLMKGHYKQKLANRNNLNLLATMDALPIRDNSMNLAVASLSLDYTSNTKTKDLVRTERENAIREANRVLKEDGYFIITLPHGVVDNEASKKLEKGLTGLGFEVIPELTGLVRSGDNNADFEVYLMTARKSRQPFVKSRHNDLRLSQYKRPSYTMRKKGVVENFNFIEADKEEPLTDRIEKYMDRIHS